DGSAPIQLFENRIERWIAPPLVAVVGEQGDAVAFERVERVRDLGEACVDVRQGQRGKQPEAAWVIRHELGDELIALVGQAYRRCRIAERIAGWCDRDQRCGK